MIGQTLGTYRIIEQIGMGGMATVYKAYDPDTDRYVAVKVLPDHYSQHPKFRARFRREAVAIARLEHPYILPIFAYGEEEDTAYLVMRYMETGTLTDRLEQGALLLDEASRLFEQIAGALDYAHQNGVIHRDVKPSNVLLDRQGNAFLTDFGIAKMVEEVSELTGTGMALGTPQYMSPEQCRGVKDLTPATDIYSLGIMLYQMVTGRVPFQAETPMAVIHMHLNDPLPLPRSLRPELPEAVENVILKAMAKDQAQRFESCAAMAEAFRGALRGVMVELPPDITEGVTMDVPRVETEQTARTPVDVPAAPTHMRPWVLVAGAGGLTLAVVISLLLVGLFGGGGTPLTDVLGIFPAGDSAAGIEPTAPFVETATAVSASDRVGDPTAISAGTLREIPAEDQTGEPTRPPTETPREFSVDDRTDPGEHPDFRRLTLSHDDNTLKVNILYESELDIDQAGDFVYMYGAHRDMIRFGSDSFDLARDAGADGHFEELLYSGTVTRSSDAGLQIEIPLSYFPDIAEKEVWAYSMTSQDRVPDDGSLRLEGAGEPATVTGGSPALIVLYNDTTSDLCHLYTSPTNGEGQMDDLIVQGEMIPSGYPHTIFDIPSGDYDLRVESCDGSVVAEESNVSLTGKIPWAIPRPIGESGVGVEDGVALTLINDTEEEVCLVWAGLPASEWSADVLDDDTIPAGVSLSVIFPAGTWALMAQDCSGGEIDYEAAFDVTSDTTWTIGP